MLEIKHQYLSVNKKANCVELGDLLLIKGVDALRKICNIFICFFILASCSEGEYISPLKGETFADVPMGYIEDSCSISLNRTNINNYRITASEPWCIVSLKDVCLHIKCLENPTAKERTAVVNITDTQDGTSSSFKVIQTGNKTLQNRITSFELVSKKGDVYKAFLVSDSVIHIVVPQEESLDSMKVRMTHTGKALFFNDSISWEHQFYNFSDFLNPHHVTLISDNDNKKQWQINIYDLPVIAIKTPDSKPIESKTERKKGCVVTLFTGDGIIDTLGTAGIKGRGNSTWLEPKKPYNVKLDKKKSILGMMPSKYWLLLSNPYYDRTQLHNAVAFEVARRTDYPWVQSGEFVELLLNEKHLGLYYLCEKIRIEDGKIDIATILPSDTIGDALTGGYMLESVQAAKNDYNFFMTSYYNTTGYYNDYQLWWEITEPEDDVLQCQIEYIKGYMNNLESLVANDSTFNSGAFLDYLDVESAINWWIVENLCINEESSRFKNVIVYKDRDSAGGILRFGPPWDFDFGTFGDQGRTLFWAGRHAWCFGRLQDHPIFVKRVKEKWNSYYSSFSTIPLYIDEVRNYIHRSALRNEIMWNRWLHSSGTYDENVDYMRESYIIQLEWMNEVINNW